MNIGICDDDKILIEEIYAEVYKYFRGKKLNCTIDKFNSGDEFLQTEKEYDLLFLDVEMPGKSGMEVAQIVNHRLKLREIKDVKIVFLTSHDEVVRSAFKVNAFRFLVKDSYKAEIRECLEAFCRECLDNTTYDVGVEGHTVSVRRNDIMYITSEHNGVEVWTRHKMCKDQRPLKYWADILDEKIFLKVHRNAIVNVDYIDYIEDEIILYSGERVKYSKRNKTELKQKFEQYIYEKAR